MAQGKRLSIDINESALSDIEALGAAAKVARLEVGEGQSAVAAKLGVHVETVGSIESGEAGVAKRTPTPAMVSPFLWPVLIPFALSGFGAAYLWL